MIHLGIVIFDIAILLIGGRKLRLQDDTEQLILNLRGQFDTSRFQELKYLLTRIQEKMDNNNKEITVPEEVLMSKIYLIRGQKVMLDEDLAKLYQVLTKRLNEQVKRNKERFPLDFMFQLDKTEFDNLKSQFATSSWGGRRKPPFVFTEHGVLMLSSVLNSEKPLPSIFRLCEFL